ncbi:MAG TPA: hypothetical protein EYO76_13325, partial [Flavobacteriaceae bacterium]|nr:hypothetical protein [Flavobacteriaceae bacterium]
HKLHAHPHAGRGRAVHQCLLCLARFVQVEDVREHMKVIHGTNLEDDKALNAKFVCARCGETFSTDVALLNHVRATHRVKRASCEICHSMFARTDALKRHMATVHNKRLKRAHACHMCRSLFYSHALLMKHFEREHPPSTSFALHEHALNKTAATYIMHLRNINTFEAVNTSVMRAHIHRLINAHLQKHPAVKVAIVVQAEFQVCIPRRIVCEERKVFEIFFQILSGAGHGGRPS